MEAKDVRDMLIGVALLAAMLLLAFWLGRIIGQADAENELIANSDTVTVTDTVRVPHDVIQTQLVTQEVVRYKYVPVTISADPVAEPQGAVEDKQDTTIQVQDGVAIIPISLKTYTDSATYRAVVSGYEARLEEIEVYNEHTVITHHLAAPRWSIGLQGGMYVTPKGLMPGIGVGVSYRIGIGKQ